MEGNILCVLMIAFILSLSGCNDNNNQAECGPSPLSSEIELPSVTPGFQSDDTAMKQVYLLL